MHLVCLILQEMMPKKKKKLEPKAYFDLLEVFKHKTAFILSKFYFFLKTEIYKGLS